MMMQYGDSGRMIGGYDEQQVAGARKAAAQLSQPSTIRHLLSSLIERTEKLAGVSVELADSIGGPEAGGLIGSDAKQGFSDDLRGMITQVRFNVERAEQAVLRSHSHI